MFGFLKKMMERRNGTGFEPQTAPDHPRPAPPPAGRQRCNWPYEGYTYNIPPKNKKRPSPPPIGPQHSMEFQQQDFEKIQRDLEKLQQDLERLKAEKLEWSNLAREAMALSMDLTQELIEHRMLLGEVIRRQESNHG